MDAETRMYGGSRGGMPMPAAPPIDEERPVFRGTPAPVQPLMQRGDYSRTGPRPEYVPVEGDRPVRRGVPVQPQSLVYDNRRPTRTPAPSDDRTVRQRYRDAMDVPPRDLSTITADGLRRLLGL
jgi:hypothetical protein